MLRRAIVLALCAVTIVLGLVACGSSKPNYSSDTMGVFMKACDPESAGGTRDAVCRCAYQRIEQEYTYEEYSQLDGDLRSDPGRELPDELMRIIAGCAVSADLNEIRSQSSNSTDASSSST